MSLAPTDPFAVSARPEAAAAWHRRITAQRVRHARDRLTPTSHAKADFVVMGSSGPELQARPERDRFSGRSIFQVKWGAGSENMERGNPVFDSSESKNRINWRSALTSLILHMIASDRCTLFGRHAQPPARWDAERLSCVIR